MVDYLLSSDTDYSLQWIITYITVFSNYIIINNNVVFRNFNTRYIINIVFNESVLVR